MEWKLGDNMKLDIQKFAALNVGDTYETSALGIRPYGYSSNAYQMKFTVKLNSQNLANFTSNITITSYMRTLANSWGWNSFGKIYMERYIKANDEVGYTLKNSTQLNNLPTNNANNWVNCGSWSGDIQHKTDGTCVLYVKNHLSTSSSSSYSYIPRDTEQTSESLTLHQLHTAPSLNIISVTETNNLLSGVGDNVFVQNLSIKNFAFEPILYDDATVSSIIFSNGTTANIPSTTSPITLDFTNKSLYIVSNEVPIKATIVDSLGGSSEIQLSYANPIMYNKPFITTTSTTVKRNGQLTGKALLNFAGTYFSGTIGSITNSIVIKYKFWEKDTTEPNTWITIPSSSITINNNDITISDYEIGTTDTSASNYFDYEKAYNVKIQIDDAFKSDEVLKTIPVGEDVWAEYKDRLRIKKIQNPNGIYSYETGNINTQSITDTLIIKKASSSEAPDDGIVLEYSPTNGNGCQLYIGNTDSQGIWYNGWDNGTRGTWKKLQEAPIVLYDNSNGENGTIQLSDSTANYSYIEILYKSIDDYCGSVKVASPNGQKVALMSNYVNNTGNSQLKIANKLISGNTISNISSLTYGVLQISTSLNRSADDRIYITKVLGYY